MGQREDDARRAKAALRPVALHHRVLHGGKRAVVRAQSLDREDMAAIGLENPEEAGIHRTVADRAAALRLTQEDGAGAARPFAAGDPGSRQAETAAQELRECLED